ncbi:hypothetical protein LSAT2_003766 [Lamellibrachia satsuma]|nr:hypothetical protein LSAT2_003766 [Lamellibrachia satsuma]
MNGAVFSHVSCGPYAEFAGRDASRGLATMTMGVKDEMDDLSDLTKAQLDSLKNWEGQFTEKYALVGRVIE